MGRYVLDQSPQTIESYFGTPIAEEGDLKTYACDDLRQVFPDLPQAATFQIQFDQDRVVRILLNANASETESFSYDPAKFFTYIFGYEPSTYQPIPLPFGGGGHEGFIDNKACLGDGVGTAWITYRLGDENIALYYDAACELPNPSELS